VARVSPGEIWIADPSEDAQHLARRLAECGRVRVLSSAAAVLEHAEVQAAQLLVVDQVLPDMSGPELVRRLRALGWRTPVVMTSAACSPEDEVEARQVGIVHFARKPIGSERVMQILRHILNRTHVSHQGESE
jgi:DNA-binding response OmpR family regulator